MEKGVNTMPIGKNVGLGDKLIRKTTKKTINTNKGNKTSNVNNTNITSIANNKNNTNNTNKTGQPSMNPISGTYRTKKMTFYVKESLLKKLYDFAYWNRHSVTEALNIALTDGLKSKNTKPKE